MITMQHSHFLSIKIGERGGGDNDAEVADAMHDNDDNDNNNDESCVSSLRAHVVQFPGRGFA